MKRRVLVGGYVHVWTEVEIEAATESDAAEAATKLAESVCQIGMKWTIPDLSAGPCVFGIRPLEIDGVEIKAVRS